MSNGRSCIDPKPSRCIARCCASSRGRPTALCASSPREPGYMPRHMSLLPPMPNGRSRIGPCIHRPPVGCVEIRGRGMPGRPTAVSASSERVGAAARRGKGRDSGAESGARRASATARMVAGAAHVGWATECSAGVHHAGVHAAGSTLAASRRRLIDGRPTMVDGVFGSSVWLELP